MQCEVLDTITGIPRDVEGCPQRFTNKEGMIYMLDPCGKVYCFDPLGDKQIGEVQDLQNDLENS